MARRYSAAQLQSVMRQMQQKQKQAVDKYNQAVRQHNATVKRAIDQYNRQVRSHNARVVRNRQHLQAAVRRLASSNHPITRYVGFGQSVQVMHTRYSRLETTLANTTLDARTEYLIDLSEREVAHSVGVAESLMGGEQEQSPLDILEDSFISAELGQIGPDLDRRWRGALFALNPNNADAARHFCASSREIFIKILDLTAPEEAVLLANPHAARADDGRVTRRARLSYLLLRQGVQIEALEKFADADLDNVMELFRLFNDGTHGAAGTFTFTQLQAIRKRVENALQFLCQIVRCN